MQHFEVWDIITVKIPREDITSIDNKWLFGGIIDESYPPRYKELTFSGTNKRLIPAKGFNVNYKTFWTEVIIPNNAKEVLLTLAAQEASTSERVEVSCQCKENYNLKNCRYYKKSMKCITSSHKHEHDCGNLSDSALLTEVALVGQPRRKRARLDMVDS